MSYPTKPMGHGNPYLCCAFCGQTDPQINGEINNHLLTCQYRQEQQNYTLSTQEEMVFFDELYNDDLQCYTVVVMAAREMEKNNFKSAIARLRVDADKLRMVAPELYAIVMKQPL